MTEPTRSRAVPLAIFLAAASVLAANVIVAGAMSVPPEDTITLTQKHAHIKRMLLDEVYRREQDQLTLDFLGPENYSKLSYLLMMDQQPDMNDTLKRIAYKRIHASAHARARGITE